MNMLHHPNIDRLFDAILLLKNKEECYEFFEDACTIMMHSGCSAFQDRSFPEGVDNLFFEKFGMSGNDVKNLLFGDFERDV